MSKLDSVTARHRAAQRLILSADPGNPDQKGDDYKLGDEDLAILTDLGRNKRYASGEFLFNQGDKHEGIIFILRGRVRSFYVSSQGREMTLAYWPGGHFVGAPQLLGGGDHMWTSVAEEPTTGVLLSGSAVREIVQTQPKLAITLIEGLVFKSRCYTAMLQMVGTQSKAVRLAHVLLNLVVETAIGEPKTFPIALTHLELAKMIGATRQSVSNTLDRFERDGLIARSEGIVFINDRQRLRRLCE